jgi:hypothetical protein
MPKFKISPMLHSLVTLEFALPRPLKQANATSLLLLQARSSVKASLVAIW